jgi:glycosyltransferase involved in cell wall biosynthesis
MAAVKVLVLSRHDRLGAGSRYRMFQYLPYLQQQGFETTVVSLLDDDYLSGRYAGTRANPVRLARAYARRCAALLTSQRYDLIWLQREALPWTPGWVESFLGRLGAPYVVDYDDAVFHVYDRHPSPMVRGLLGKKIDRIMRGAALVIVGNQYLADHARSAGAHRIEILPTVVDLTRYPPVPHPANDVFTIGWIGTPLTARYLDRVYPALKEVCADNQARLVAVGAGGLDWPDVPVEVRAWSEATEVAALQEFDVGIMPLPDTPFERGKCGLKLIQYLACSRPVVASPVGMNATLVTDGANGYLATGHEEWANALRALQRDRIQRFRMGEAGRALVEAQFSLDSAAPRLAELLRSARRRRRYPADHRPSQSPG